MSKNPMFRIAAVAAATIIACGLPLVPAPACTTASPKPVVETWKPSTITEKGVKITIFTGPVDRMGELQIASGPGRALWFPDHTTSDIARFELTGKVTVWPTPTPNADPQAIAVAPNHSVTWFTEHATNCVGKITTTGVIIEFATSVSPLQSVLALTGTRASGDVWFGTDFNGIGRIAPTGKVAFFDIADNSSQPTALTLDKKGNIWYVEWDGNSIGYIMPTGGGKAFDVGLGEEGSYGIAFGPDGRIWFADPTNKRIGRINTNGTGLKYFSSGLTGDPDSIIAGPDGNLYFGEFSPAVGRITTNGAITEFPVPDKLGSFPVLSLTIGPDGNIWFTNNAHSQIGKLIP
jgi:streptogramin lyase